MTHSQQRLAWLLPLSLFLYLPQAGAESITWSCTRVEKDFSETYELQVVSTGSQKGKVFLDGRDLDRTASDSTQLVKHVSISKEKVTYLIDTLFEPEVLEGVTYSAGSVISSVSIDRNTGKLRKVETVQGGILGANLGNGTRAFEEQCTLQSVSRTNSAR